jgi:outer membrane receptor protein involved in Fe transport
MKTFLRVMGLVFALNCLVISPRCGWAVEQSATRTGGKTETQTAEEAASRYVELEDIVVTATGNVKMRDTPASISVITAKDIEAQGIKNIGEALAKVAGVFDDGSSSYYFSLRGTRSSSSGGPLVLVDGVRQDVGMLGYNYFETIPVAEIERIEILRSPGSTVFGADSARGIISIITKKADKKKKGLKGSVSASAGSWSTFDESATLSGVMDRWDLLFSGSRTDTEGYLHNEQERSAARVKAGYSFSDQARLGLNLSYKDNHWQTVRGKNRYALENDREADEFQETPTAKLTSYNETDQEASSLGLDFGYKAQDLFFDILAAATQVDEEHDARYATYTSPKSVYRDDRNQDRYNLDVSGGYRFGQGFFQYTPKLGFNLETTALEQRRDYYNDPVGKAASKRKADIDFDQEKAGLFFQNQLLFGERWELNAGGRAGTKSVTRSRTATATASTPAAATPPGRSPPPTTGTTGPRATCRPANRTGTRWPITTRRPCST